MDLFKSQINFRRSKTPAGWRQPCLNNICRSALAALYANAKAINAAEPDHYVFPWHGRNRRIDPTKPMTSWRTAWRSMLKAAGLTGVHFHHGRHTAITAMQEKGIADWVIRAHVGYVSKEMMKTYSNIRRKALEQASEALEPTFLKSIQHNIEPMIQ